MVDPGNQIRCFYLSGWGQWGVSTRLGGGGKGPQWAMAPPGDVTLLAGWVEKPQVSTQACGGLLKGSPDSCQDGAVPPGAVWGKA